MDPVPHYMQRCLDLAVLGLGKVSPNPLVGCVIVDGDEVIGEGYHQGFGLPHAEVNAINSVMDKSRLRTSVLYVNLEPCAHHGKTPPCADLILSYEIPEVVIGTIDPYPAVSGRGMQRLIDGGVKVHLGIMEKACSMLNKRFFTFYKLNRPYIILKWAQSADGFIAPENYQAEERSKYWITGRSAVEYVHKWRVEEDAILVGHRTVIADNPRLTAREWPGRNPLRMVLDPDYCLTKEYAVFNQESVTIHYNCNAGLEEGKNLTIRINGIDFLSDVIQDAVTRNIQSIIVEGGAQTLNQFILRDLWDEARVFTGKRRFGSGIKAPLMHYPPDKSLQIGEDNLSLWKHPKSVNYQE